MRGWLVWMKKNVRCDAMGYARSVLGSVLMKCKVDVRSDVLVQALCVVCRIDERKCET